MKRERTKWNLGKVLAISPEKCTGCRLCELVCSVFHDGVSNASRSRIKVIKWEAEGIYIPMSCQQCQDAPCKIVCPVKAISRDEKLSRVDGGSQQMHRLPLLRGGLPLRRDGL